ncbi:hypothetical protein, partial [Sporolactobacillus vineae]|uniref:hypothetical protein n=1 Tax=Sporolactobacillus vineae TaxID=444463 RepID=UPI001EE64673
MLRRTSLNQRLLEKAKESLDEAKKDSEKGRSIKQRKKVTIMYLSSRPIKMKNMLNYAVDAQKLFSVPIPGCDSIYDRRIDKKVKKQIGNFQREF